MRSLEQLSGHFKNFTHPRTHLCEQVVRYRSSQLIITVEYLPTNQPIWSKRQVVRSLLLGYFVRLKRKRKKKKRKKD